MSSTFLSSLGSTILGPLYMKASDLTNQKIAGSFKIFSLCPSFFCNSFFFWKASPLFFHWFTAHPLPTRCASRQGFFFFFSMNKWQKLFLGKSCLCPTTYAPRNAPSGDWRVTWIQQSDEGANKKDSSSSPAWSELSEFFELRTQQVKNQKRWGRGARTYERTAKISSLSIDAESFVTNQKNGEGSSPRSKPFQKDWLHSLWIT